MPQDNKATILRYYLEVCNAGNVAVLDELFAPDYVNHNPGPGLPPTREGDKLLIAMYRMMFPDLHVTVEDMLCDGDKIVTRWMGRATHQGEMIGVPPTGRKVTFTGIDISRVANGKIQESWHQEDRLGLMQQLGVLPSLVGSGETAVADAAGLGHGTCSACVELQGLAAVGFPTGVSFRERAP